MCLAHPALIQRLIEHDSDLIQMLTEEQALSDEEKQSRVEKRGSRVTPTITTRPVYVSSNGSTSSRESGKKHARKKQLFPVDGGGREDMGSYSAQVAIHQTNPVGSVILCHSIIDDWVLPLSFYPHALVYGP